MANWKSVVGWEALYEVSDEGEVRSLGHYYRCMDGRMHRSFPCTLRQKLDNGYARVQLCRYGSRHIRPVHVLVLEAFVSTCPKGHETRHLDGNRRNNVISNLRWGTRLENMADQYVHGTRVSGARNWTTKLTHDDVLEIKDRLADGHIPAFIANDFGVHRNTIYKIRDGVLHAEVARHVGRQP